MIYSTTVINPLSLNSCELKLQSVLNILDDFLHSWTDSVHFREKLVLTCVHMALLKEVFHLLFKENQILLVASAFACNVMSDMVALVRQRSQLQSIVMVAVCVRWLNFLLSNILPSTLTSDKSLFLFGTDPPEVKTPQIQSMHSEFIYSFAGFAKYSDCFRD